MAATDAIPVPKKNTAYRHMFAIRDKNGDLVTGWTGADSEISQDGGAYADATNEATEIGSSGTGYIDLTAAEMNYDCVGLIVTVTNTDAKDYVVFLYPEEAGDIRTNTTQIEDSDPSDTIRDAVVDDSTRIDASALNTLSNHDPGETIMGATDLDTEMARIDADISSRAVAGDNMNLADDAITAAKYDQSTAYPVTIADIVAGVWNAILTGATYNIPASAGRRLREATGCVIVTGTSTGSNTVNTLNLDTDASTTDGAYDPAALTIVAGTGAGQSRLILEYDGANRRAYVDRDWKVTPDDTSEYTICANPGREHVNEGLAQGGASSSITLNSLASATDDEYVGQLVFIRSGTGADQVGLVTDYDGSTKVATVQEAWAVTPDTTSVYAVLPDDIPTNAALEALVNAQCDAALADYAPATEAKQDAHMGSGFVESTDSNEAIRDRGDVAWTTGAGGSAPTVEEIRTEMDDNSTKLAAIEADTDELQTNQGNWLTATGFSTHSANDVWAVTSRTLSSFGTLVSDMATAVWEFVTRTITGGTVTASNMRGTDDAATEAKQDIIDTNVDTVLTNQTTINTNVLANGTAIAASDDKIDLLQTDVTEIVNYEAGSWKIENNQMIFYKKDNTELQRFDLKKDGSPSMDEPDERTRV